MVSQFMDVLRRGIWAGLTGGWFYDTGLDVLTNVIHLYFWIVLLLAPFLLYLLLPPSTVAWGLYCAVVAVVYFVIKFGNHLMHQFFDSHESEAIRGEAGISAAGSSRGSVESLSENVVAFSVDTARRRQSGRIDSQNEECIPLQSMDGTAAGRRSPAFPDEAGLSPTTIRPRGASLCEDVPASDGVPELVEIAEGNSNAPDEVSEPNEILNFKAEVHTVGTTKTENSDEIQGKSDVAPNRIAIVRETTANDVPNPSEVELEDKFLPVAVSKTPMERHFSAGQLQERGLLRQAPRRRGRKHRVNNTAVADSSVTSVLNQPTSSMETILSTFKPTHSTATNDPSALLSSSAFPSTSGSQLQSDSSRGLRRARSEFYTPKRLRSAFPDNLSQAMPNGGSSASVLFNELKSSDEKDTGQAGSEPSLRPDSDDEVQEQISPQSGVLEAVPTDVPDVSSDSTAVASKIREVTVEEGAVLYDDYLQHQMPTVNPRRSRSRATRQRRLHAALDNAVHRHVPVSPSVSDTNRDADNWVAVPRDYLDYMEHLHPQPNDLAPRAAGESIGAGARPLQGTSLLRRERENRTRPDSPDPRAVRLESMTNSYGLINMMTSWLSGNHTDPSNWPLPSTVAQSRPRSDHVHAEDELHCTRYSPQTSIGSDQRPEPLLLPSQLSTVDSASTSSGHRLNLRVHANPLWRRNVSLRESGDDLETNVDGSRSAWHLVDNTSAHAARAGVEGAGHSPSPYVHFARGLAEVRSNSTPEYRIGPMSWRELFEGVDPDSNNHVRFVKPVYKLPICPWFKQPHFIEINLDRLSLMAILDRTRGIMDCVAGVLLAVMVAACGGYLLHRQLFVDIPAFILCFVMAGCQYGLLKSVQPDSASPTHGFNRLAVYNRSAYFCLFTGLIVLVDHLALLQKNHAPFQTFGFNLYSYSNLIFARDILSVFLLCFPIIFAYGLFPQMNTFAMYVLEQIDIHVFGGSATASLLSAGFVVLRNILFVLALHGVCYASLSSYAPRGVHTVNLTMSCFAGLIVAVGYHLSRMASDPGVLWNVIRRMIKKGDCLPWSVDDVKAGRNMDPSDVRMEQVVYNRLRSDLSFCPIAVILFFGIHASTILSMQFASDILVLLTVIVGFFLSYVAPKLRVQMPWMFFSKPLVPSYRQSDRNFQPEGLVPKLTRFERAFLWLRIIERNILYPCVLVSILSSDTISIVPKYGVHGSSVLLTICGLKFVRLAFTDPESQYLVLAFTTLYFRFDAGHGRNQSETFLLNYWIISLLYYKLQEWLLKWKFVLTYVAPWQIAWGSAFHAFAQPFSIPHSGLLFVQSVFSTLISSPLNPFLGSAIFLTTYPRPVKFWEKNYKTRRLDHSNTRLDTQLDGNSGNDDNNLNSIFYEHLTHSLQKSLCGDITMGKWGSVASGDFFILASDYLNCLVHIVEVGNGLITFQVRGLEFRGTYCQQREVEAITESVDENRGCFCCEPGHLPSMLSVNAAFNQRWLTWQVIAGKYVVQGYSVSDNNATTMFQIYDLRRVLVTFYIKTIIFYLVKHPKVLTWMLLVEKELATFDDLDCSDLDPLFMPNIDIDFDLRCHGVSRRNFYRTMHSWIVYCINAGDYPETDTSEKSPFVTLAFALSICGRRLLGAAAQLSVHSVDWFLHGLHALFKGDFRLNCQKDEWVFADMDLLNQIVGPAVRMALKLHQDHFTAPDEYDRCPALYDAITEHDVSMVICHEGDPKWRQAVLANTPSLLALRHVVDENHSHDDYKIIMLNIRNLEFRLIKANRECVRGFWAGQLQELIYFRNRNPERGSIQNAKQALRNMINSSCDQPIGYPIYVSPLTTSFAETHEKMTKTVGGPFTWENIRGAVQSFWEDVRDRCYASCSGSSGEPRVVRHREPPVVVSYNPQAALPVEFLRRPNAAL